MNAVNEMGLAAVHGAANRGSDDIIELLAKNGARLDLADKEGRTPIDLGGGRLSRHQLAGRQAVDDGALEEADSRRDDPYRERADMRHTLLVAVIAFIVRRHRSLA